MWICEEENEWIGGVIGLAAAGIIIVVCNFLDDKQATNKHSGDRSNIEQTAEGKKTPKDLETYALTNCQERLHHDLTRRIKIEPAEAESLAVESIKYDLNDPYSVRDLTCSVTPCKYAGLEGYWLATAKFRAKNIYGGYEKRYVYVLGEQGNIIKSYYDEVYNTLIIKEAQADLLYGLWYYPESRPRKSQ